MTALGFYRICLHITTKSTNFAQIEPRGAVLRLHLAIGKYIRQEAKERRIRRMNGIYTILLLVCSNVFMTLAWYGHLRLQQTGTTSNWPLIGVIAFSWAIAFLEYCCQVPANRIGFAGNGGPFSLMQLKVIQEVISLIVFCLIANVLFQGQQLHWNHLAAGVCLVLAVYFIFK